MDSLSTESADGGNGDPPPPGIQFIFFIFLLYRLIGKREILGDTWKIMLKESAK